MVGLRPELSLCRLVIPEFRDLSHNPPVELEKQHRLRVRRLSVALARVPVKSEHVIAGCGDGLQLGAHGAVGLVSEAAKKLQDRLGASIISRQYPGDDRMPDRIRRKERLQRLDVAFCEGFVAAPNSGDVSLSCVMSVPSPKS
jgi:hypothetical protein